MLGQRNFGWGDVTWGNKAMGRHNLTPRNLLSKKKKKKQAGHDDAKKISAPAKKLWEEIIQFFVLTKRIVLNFLSNVFLLNIV